MKKNNVKGMICVLLIVIAFPFTGCEKNDSGQTQINNQSDQSMLRNSGQQLDVNKNQIDYYADADFAVPDKFDEQRQDVTYGVYQEHLTYYSSVIDQEKEYSVILPPNFSESAKYPVIYALHGFGSNPGEWEFATTLYGNMIADGLAVPAIIVIPDVWTDVRNYDDCDGYEQRASYDKIINDLKDSLMPLIESQYPVLPGRDHTAIMGMSQGGTEALAAGFLLQDKIGYIASLAPCPGVIPTEYFKDTFWNTPIMDDFIINSPDTMPRYILLTVGSEDPWNIECTQYYDQVLTQKGIPHHYYMLDGGDHGYTTWADSFYNFIRRSFPAG